MQNQVNFIIGIHCHQPTGNFNWVFEEAYQKAYLPFIDILEKHPKIKMNVHYSGCLWDWIFENHPEFVKKIKHLVKIKQVEIISGGYYEPILPLIPDADKSGQILMANNIIKKQLGSTPSGMWLAERVWEPALPKYLSPAGITYTIIDDTHFKSAGLRENEIFGYYITEDDGYKLLIFPTLEKLRYLIPFQLPEKSIEYLRSVRENNCGAVVIADDGEKFGLWPGTHKWVYEEKWLQNFFTILENNLSWINITTFSEYIKKNPPRGRIYIPCASYKEMLEWSGGYFRNFLVKYYQSNNMHKKMLLVSEKVAKIKAKTNTDKRKKTEAIRYLYKGQCNCSYWHGVFGGLYLYHLRHSVFQNLITAEKITDQLLNKNSKMTCLNVDLNRDGWDEILVSNSKLNAYFNLQFGGTLFELDFKPAAVNITNVLSRIPETYHRNLAAKKAAAKSEKDVKTIHELLGTKEDHLENFLYYDWYNRSSFLDHFFGENVTIGDFYRSHYQETGDFINQAYSYKMKKNKQKTNLMLIRNGTVFACGNKPLPITVVKTFSFKEHCADIDVFYNLKNCSDQSVNLWFGVEFNFSVQSEKIKGIGEMSGVRDFALQDVWNNLEIKFNFSENSNLWYFPIETVSESEEGIEKTYQGMSLLFHWKFKLLPEEKKRISLLQAVSVLS
ncbi:MAG: alpha-amylase/4-alpha-glucanotransferase domain-containing protein [Candidatus Omnitrophota bacterium]